MASAFPIVEGYSQLQLIGEGGFSRVYSATEDALQRTVALKVLKFRLESVEEQERFEGECQAMGQLSHHPHIVSLYSTTYTTENYPAIVMELAGNGTLGDDRNLGPKQVLDTGVKLASALHFAHGMGIIHRDVKPKNVLTTRFGEPALTDFGISAIAERSGAEQRSGITLAYAPPEAFDGEVNPSSDVYSLAATLYAALTGGHPHRNEGGQSKTELVRKILYEDPPPLKRMGFPADFDSIIVKQGMAKSLHERTSSAHAFGEALRNLQRSEGFELTAFAEVAARNQPQAFAELDDSSQSSDPSVTVVRTRVGQEPESEPERSTGEQRPWSQRRIVASVAGAMAIGLLTIFLLLGRGGRMQVSPTASDEGPPQASSTQDLDLYTAQVLAPSDLALSRQFDGSVLITWSDPNSERNPVVNVVFEIDGFIESAGSGSSTETWKAEGTSHALQGISDSEALCIEMRAIGPSGRQSNQTDPECLTVDVGAPFVVAAVPPSCRASECAFRLDAKGLQSQSSVSIRVEGPDGTDLNSVFSGVYESNAQVDRLGSIDWQFRPQPEAPIGRYRATVTDDLSGQSSVTFFELVDE